MLLARHVEVECSPAGSDPDSGVAKYGSTEAAHADKLRKTEMDQLPLKTTIPVLGAGAGPGDGRDGTVPFLGVQVAL